MFCIFTHLESKLYLTVLSVKGRQTEEIEWVNQIKYATYKKAHSTRSFSVYLCYSVWDITQNLTEVGLICKNVYG